MTDQPVARVVTRQLVDALDVSGRLPDRLLPASNAESRPEHRVDALLMVEVEVPRVEVLVEVRKVHVGAADEVPVAHVGVAQGFDVRDLARAERLLLRWT